MTHPRFRGPLLACCALALVAVVLGAPATAQEEDPDAAAFERLRRWVVEEHGGMTRAVLGRNRFGLRGLYAAEDIKKGENIMSIPAATILNAAGQDNSFFMPVVSVLRELKDPASRLKPYVDIWPKPGNVLNAATLPQRYLPMFKNSHWASTIDGWVDSLQAYLNGKYDATVEYTIAEAVGSIPVTLEDLQHACAIATTRYLAANRRRRMIMVPIFDLLNHRHNCPHEVNEYSRVLHLTAGRDVKAGEELCFSYGEMYPDYAFVHYGFLPPVEDPPRLLMVDHHNFRNNTETEIGLARFAGNPDQVRAERERLRGILKEVEATPDEVERLPGDDYIWDTLKELERRRKKALRHEINRLTALLQAAGAEDSKAPVKSRPEKSPRSNSSRTVATAASTSSDATAHACSSSDLANSSAEGGACSGTSAVGNDAASGSSTAAAAAAVSSA